MSDVQNPSESIADVRARRIARKSYRYLRLAIVALLVLLAASLVQEHARAGELQFGSISAFYYSAVRAVFVGVLVGVGPLLVALKGRNGAEDVLLDLAGMLIPLVALVPTPCREGCQEGVAPEYLYGLGSAVQNNVAAIGVVGAVVLLFAGAGALRARSRSALVGPGIALLVWLGYVVWFFAARDVFEQTAHYVSAVGFFALIVAVCVVGWRLARTRPQVNVPGRPVHYSRIYGLTGLGMAAVIVVGVVLGLGRHLAGWGTPFTLIFWVEALLLGLFGVFWVAQTVENWQVEAREPAAPGGP
jgi:hypothetical protein